MYHFRFKIFGFKGRITLKWCYFLSLSDSCSWSNTWLYHFTDDYRSKDHMLLIVCKSTKSHLYNIVAISILRYHLWRALEETSNYQNIYCPSQYSNIILRPHHPAPGNTIIFTDFKFIMVQTLKSLKMIYPLPCWWKAGWSFVVHKILIEQLVQHDPRVQKPWDHRLIWKDIITSEEDARARPPNVF